MVFFKNGEIVKVIVDNYIPCLAGKPVFSEGNASTHWAIILEKAWAKLHNGYEQMSGGQIHEVFSDLLGAPSFEIPIF